jgi:exosome complex component RRP42
MEAINVVKGHYIRELAAKNAREDGRGMFDFRNISIKTGVLGNAEGSAQADLGSTRVLCGVKIQVDKPMPDTPEQGNLIVSSELLPLAHPDFESGPPRPESIELARVVDRGIRAANVINLTSLFIEPEIAWSVFVDLYVLDYGGNLFDTSTLAAMAALNNAKMPKYVEKKGVYTDKTESLKIDSTVCSTTFCKIENTLMLDPSMSEENGADARITIVNDGSLVRAMQKGKSGSFSMEEIETLVDVSLSKYTGIKKVLDGLK